MSPVRAVLLATAFASVSIGLLVNFIWWRIALPYCVSAHNDGLLLTGISGSILLAAIDILAIGFGGHAYRMIEAAITESNDEDS